MAIADRRHARLDSIQALRGLAAIAVVLFHTHQFELDHRYFGHPPMGGFFAWGLHGVDLFFVISGFIMAHVHFEDFRRGTGWKRFLVSRASRIYAPYWPVLAAATLAYFIAPTLENTANAAMRDSVTILRSAILWPGTSGLLSIAWTLQHEVVFYCVVMIALMRPTIGVLVFILWQSYALVGPSPSTPADIGKLQMGPYEMEFAFGIACMAILRRFPLANYPKTILAAGTASFVAIALYTTYVRDFAPFSFASTICYGLAASAILVGAVYCERAGCLRLPSMVMAIGGASYSIYLIHYPLLSVLSKLLGRVGINGAGAANPVFVGLSLICIVAGCLYHQLAERRSIAVARALLVRAVGTDRQEPETRRGADGSVGAGMQIPVWTKQPGEA